jgi:glycosyltransferase involved in cell wall biosynthesis
MRNPMTAAVEAASTRRRRVLFVNQYFPPDEAATAQILGDLVEDAVRAGFECRVIASDRGYADPAKRYPRREDWKGAAVERVGATGFGRASALGRAIDYGTFALNAALRLLSGPRPDVVVGLSTPPILGALAVFVGRLRGARSVYWAMDVYPDVAFALGAVAPASVAGRLLSALSGWTVRSADLVIALGDTMAALLRRQCARQVAVVHNWTDDVGIRPLAPGATAFRAERGWASRFVVVYSGNMGLAHEFETVLAAAGRLRAWPVTFAFVGDGPRRKEIEAAVAAQQLENVEFHPGVARNALGDSLAAADLHLVTLRPGVQGLLVPSKIYGIMAAGIPTLYVGPTEGEVFEIVTRNRCGAAISNGDVAGLEKAILAYLSDPEMRRREGVAARATLELGYRRVCQTRALLDSLAALAREEH